MPRGSSRKVTVAPAADAPSHQSRPPLPTSQKEALKAQRAAKQQKIHAELEAWYQQTAALAAKLGEEFDQSQSHFLTLMFQFGTKEADKRKPNLYNAWLHWRANQVNEDLPRGERKKLRDIQLEHGEEYYDLTDAQKEEIKADLVKERDSTSEGAFRLTSRGRLKILYSTLKKIENMYEFLKIMCGIDVMSLIVRNDTSFHFSPIWFFTDKSIPGYLVNNVRKGWDSDRIAAMVEAFVLAKCDLRSMANTSKLKAKRLKAQIQDKITELLVAITKNPNVHMHYKNFERDIVIRYGIDIEGWTHPTFNSPSKLSTSLPPLQTLFDALESGACRFVDLSTEDLAKRKADYAREVASGEIAPRKTRSDAGRKRRKQAKRSVPGGRAGGGDDGSSSSESSDEEREPETDGPARKRRRTATSGARKTAPKSRAIVDESD
ncbi:hypothetical protein EVJ58_g10430 [Rhodofomes roseus]|uniref:Uncharacterized protein n=1 Tax=Rhodofomes roseus TaxID=34475 RepID=A0A4Y9XQQ5_9APHY|nr:hypothetical protein EVJ58_g10430 [Rhodofomes roseus]